MEGWGEGEVIYILHRFHLIFQWMWTRNIWEHVVFVIGFIVCSMLKNRLKPKV
jgi:hypothetical protein